MRTRNGSGRLVLMVLAVLMLFTLTGCELIQNLIPGGGAVVYEPLEAFIFMNGGNYTSWTGHPTDEDGGLIITVRSAEPCFIDWGDGSVDTPNGTMMQHTYTWAGIFTVRCYTNDPPQEVFLKVTATNERPVIGYTLLYDSILSWRQGYTVLLNPHIGGCDSATGEFLYDAGVIDPDGDSTRKRITAQLVQEVLTDGEVTGYKTLETWTVFSIHDRSNITNKWVDVWGFWFSAGGTGVIPPYPFGTWPYGALDPSGVGPMALDLPECPDVSMKALPVPMDWPGPDWPDPGCPDCEDPEDPPVDPDDPDDPEDPPANPVVTAGDCYALIKVEAVDQWGGYAGLVWKYGMPSCSENCSGGGSPTVPPVTPPGGGCGG